MATTKITQTCSLTHCDLPVSGNGYCKAHNQRVAVHGDKADLLKPIRHVTRKPKMVGCTVKGCLEPHAGRGFCQHHFGKWNRYGDATYEPPKGHSTNPWQLTDEGLLPFIHSKCIETPKGCWEWQGTRNAQGYGKMKLWGKHQSVHRITWAIMNGRWPELDVLHHCDNSHCCNPEHLYEGTDADNVRDCLERGRHRVPKGEETVMAKITETDVRAIRKLSALSSKEIIAKLQLPIHKSSVYRILRGQSWVHVK